MSKIFPIINSHAIFEVSNSDSAIVCSKKDTFYPIKIKEPSANSQAESDEIVEGFLFGAVLFSLLRRYRLYSTQGIKSNSSCFLNCRVGNKSKMFRRFNLGGDTQRENYSPAPCRENSFQKECSIGTIYWKVSPKIGYSPVKPSLQTSIKLYK